MGCQLDYQCWTGLLFRCLNTLIRRRQDSSGRWPGVGVVDAELCALLRSRWPMNHEGRC